MIRKYSANSLGRINTLIFNQVLTLALSLLICTVAVSPDDVFAQNQFDEIQIQSTDIDPDPPGFSSSESRYGSDVVLHDGRLVMSGTGSPLIIFQKIDDAWEELQVLFLPQGATLPSSTRPLALATFGNFLLIGDSAASHEGTSAQTGLVYLAEWNGAAYQVNGVLAPEEPAMQLEFSAFGAALSISSNFLFVGAPGADDGKGRVFAYDIPLSFPDIVLQSPIASLQASSSGAEGFGASLGASESWLVTKQETPGGTVPVSAVAYPLSPALFDSPVIINLDAQSAESGGSDIHVRSDVVLIRRKKDSSSFSTRSDYLQFRLEIGGFEELPTLSDNDPDRGFIPALAAPADSLHLVSVFDDPAFGNPAPRIFTADWNGSEWDLMPVPAEAPEDLLTFDEVRTISSAAAEPASLMLGNPAFRPGGSSGGGVSILSLDEPIMLEQTIDAGRDGSVRMLGFALSRTETSIIVGAPGWCKVYILDAAAPDFSLKQTLSAEPPCFFGEDVLADSDSLYVGNPEWEPSSGPFAPSEGQVHVFRLEGDSYVEQASIRVQPHTGLRRLGKRLAKESGRLFIAGSGEIFMFNTFQIPNGPAASATFGNVVGRNGMDLAAGHETVVVSVSGSLGGELSIFDEDLTPMDTISDSAADFGRALETLSATRFVTTRLESMAIFELSGQIWSLVDSISPEPGISRFGAGIVTHDGSARIGTASGFVTSRLDNGNLSLDVPVSVVEPDFLAPATEMAIGSDPYSTFVAYPNRTVSQSKRDLLLFVEFEAIIKRDGFEDSSP